MVALSRSPTVDTLSDPRICTTCVHEARADLLVEDRAGLLAHATHRAQCMRRYSAPLQPLRSTVRVMSSPGADLPPEPLSALARLFGIRAYDERRDSEYSGADSRPPGTLNLPDLG
jgi:hypothetical protein